LELKTTGLVELMETSKGTLGDLMRESESAAKQGGEIAHTTAMNLAEGIAEAMAKQQSRLDSLKVEIEYAISKNEVYAKIEKKNQLLQAVADAAITITSIGVELTPELWRKLHVALAALREFEKGEKNGK
jgi:phospholipase/lecithinase/hemolysin